MKIILSLAMLVFIAPFAFSATGDTMDIRISWTTDSARLLDSNGGRLDAGTAAFGDGAVVQLGYYSSGSTANNFGTTLNGSDWIALTGEGSANSAFQGYSMGDGDVTTSTGGQVDGEMLYRGIVFTEGLAGADVFPSLTTIPLVIRFYDTTSIGPTSVYNAVSSDSWTWVKPTPSATDFKSLTSSASLEWLDSANAFKTSIPVGAAIPEPSTYALLGMGLLGFLMVRRK